MVLRLLALAAGLAPLGASADLLDLARPPADRNLPIRGIPSGWAVEAPTQLTIAPAPEAAREPKGSEAFTLAAWLTPTTEGAAAPGEAAPVARLLSLGTTGLRRNLALDVTRRGAALELGWYVRTSETTEDGAPRFGATTEVPLPLRPIHLVLVRTAEGTETLFVDGEAVASVERPGSLAAWDDGAELTLFNDPAGRRPWVGEVQRLLLESKAWSPAEVRARALADAPSDGAAWLRTTPVEPRLALRGGQLSGDVLVWLENPSASPVTWTARCEGLPPAVRIGGPERGTLAARGRAPLRLGVHDLTHGAPPLGRFVGRLVVEVPGADGAAATPLVARTLVLDHVDGPDLRPGTDDTGPSTAALRHEPAGFTLRTHGEVLAATYVHGPLVIDADDVVLRDVVVDGGDARFAVRLAAGRKNLRLERVWLRGGSEATLCARSCTLRGVRIDAGAGIGALLLGDATVERCWIRAAEPRGAPLALVADTGRVRFFEVRLDATPTREGALSVRSLRGPIHGVAIERCWLAGGEYSLTVLDGGYGAPTAIALRDNTFAGGVLHGALLTGTTEGWHGAGNHFGGTGLPLDL